MPPESVENADPLFLVAGVGSVGNRHLNNLRALGIRNLLLFRTGLGSPAIGPESGEYPVESSLEKALARGPKAVIVSNPTSLHVETALQAARSGAHLFIEKPLSHAPDGVEDLAREVETRGLTAMVAFQFRFHPGLRRVKAWLEEGKVGKVVSAHAFWGEYLPNWHPWEDYRSSYSALPSLGGGVIHTLSHPIDYLRWLLGPVVSVSAETGSLSKLGIPAESVGKLTLRHDSGAVASVYLDYVRRPPRHDLEIVGSDGTIRWANEDGVARLYEAEVGDWIQHEPPAGFERNDLFLSEMSQFLDCLSSQEQPDCTLEDGVQALRIALAAHRSAEEGRRVDV
jgi:predicted dehydrogenase